MGDRDRREGHHEIEAQILELREDFSALCQQVEGIIENQENQIKATAALVEAWNTGTGLVRFIKWAAVLSGSIATLTAVWHADFSALAAAIKGNH